VYADPANYPLGSHRLAMPRMRPYQGSSAGSNPGGATSKIAGQQGPTVDAVKSKKWGVALYGRGGMKEPSSTEASEHQLHEGELVTSRGKLYDSYGRLALDSGWVAEVARVLDGKIVELKSEINESFYADAEKLTVVTAEGVAAQTLALARRRDAHAVLVGCTFLGGYNSPLDQGSRTDVLLDDEGLQFFHTGSVLEPQFVIPFAALRGIGISGPGEKTTDAGVIGGGFGLEGIVLGVALATLVNAVTRKTTINTFMRIEWNRGEAFFHYDKLPPELVRIMLSRAFVALRQASEEHSTG
jgi:hypothetical protein